MLAKKEVWAKKRLGDVCGFQNGFAFKSERYKKVGLPILRISNIQNQCLEIEDLVYFESNDYKDNFDRFKVSKGDLVIAMSGATTGKLGINTTDTEFYLNQRVGKFIPQKELLNSYLYYFLSTKVEENLRIAAGVAQPNLSSTQINNFEIPIAPIPIQQQIVSELDTLSDIIAKKKEQLADLDKLAQAKFYDMFGDPVRNEKGWEKGFLKDHTTKIGSGATPSGGNQSYRSEGISLIRSMNVHNGKFIYKDLAFIDQVQAKQLNNVTIQENDVLINITGASVARSCIVPRKVLPARVNQHVSIIRLKQNLNSLFVNALFIFQAYQEKLIGVGKANGATREAITKSQLEVLEILIPPMTLQLKFANNIEIIEKQKGLINKSIADVQQLFDYTMDKYFN